MRTQARTPTPTSFAFMMANLALAVDVAATIELAPDKTFAQAEAAKLVRHSVLAWLIDNGLASALDVAKQFGFHKSTAHSHLNRLVADGQAKMLKNGQVRMFRAVP